MLHYHVWFNLRPGVSESEGLAAASDFLDDLQSSGQACDAQLLVNTGKAPRSKLPRFHAFIEFVDAHALSEAMRRQAEKGIHLGLHGAVTKVVTDMHVEVFETAAGLQEAQCLGACEI